MKCYHKRYILINPGNRKKKKALIFSTDYFLNNV